MRYRLWIHPTDVKQCRRWDYLIYHDYHAYGDAEMAGNMLKNPAKGLFAVPVKDYYITVVD